MKRTALIFLVSLWLPLVCAAEGSATVGFGASTLSATVSADLPEKQIEQVAQRLSEGQRVSLSYSCTVDGYAPVELSGSLLLQGNCYRAEGNGVEIYCDGSTRWTVDRSEKEVYIESSDGIREVMQYKDSLKTLTLSELKYLPGSEDLSPFSFDTTLLDSSWLVTDLR